MDGNSCACPSQCSSWDPESTCTNLITAPMLAHITSPHGIIFSTVDCFLFLRLQEVLCQTTQYANSVRRRRWSYLVVSTVWHMTFLIWLKKKYRSKISLCLCLKTFLCRCMKQLVLLAAGSCIFVRCLLPNWLLSLEAFHSLFFKLGFFASLYKRPLTYLHFFQCPFLLIPQIWTWNMKYQ